MKTANEREASNLSRIQAAHKRLEESMRASNAFRAMEQAQRVAEAIQTSYIDRIQAVQKRLEESIRASSMFRFGEMIRQVERALSPPISPEMLRVFGEHAAEAWALKKDAEEAEAASIAVSDLLEEVDDDDRSVGSVLDRLLGLLDRIENPNKRDLVKHIIYFLICWALKSVVVQSWNAVTTSRSDAIRESREQIRHQIDAEGVDSDVCQCLRIVNDYRVRVHAGPRAKSGVVAALELRVIVVVHEKRKKWIEVAHEWRTQGIVGTMADGKDSLLWPTPGTTPVTPNSSSVKPSAS